MNFYKKATFIFILILFGSITLIKFTVISLENKILEISKSQKFYNFVEQRFKYELDRLSKKNFTIEETQFYNDRLNKIIKKLKPITKNLDTK